MADRNTLSTTVLLSHSRAIGVIWVELHSRFLSLWVCACNSLRGTCDISNFLRETQGLPPKRHKQYNRKGADIYYILWQVSLLTVHTNEQFCKMGMHVHILQVRKLIFRLKTPINHPGFTTQALPSFHTACLPFVQASS